MQKQYKLFFLMLIFVLLLDQATKYITLRELSFWKEIVVIPNFFNLVLVMNKGAAFGFLNDPNIEWQFWLFLIATVIALGVILYLLKVSLPNILLSLSLGSISGGAIGNLIDRLRFRAVVDFLDFYYNSWHWPAFNVADMGICIGAFFVIVIIWQQDKKQSF